MMILQLQFGTTYMLLPLTEAQLLLLDLLGEALAQGLLLLLELEVVALPRPGLSRLAGLELLLAVVLVVELLRRRNEVEHVRTDEQRAQLAEITVLVVLDCRVVVLVDSHNEWGVKHTLSHTPEVFTSLDDTTIRKLDVLGRADDRVRDGLGKNASILRCNLILSINRRSVDANALGVDDFADLYPQRLGGVDFRYNL
jgi:hypothetical protein